MKKTKTKRKRIALIVVMVIVAGLGVWYAVGARSSSKKATTAKTETKTAAEVDQADDLAKPTETKNASGDTTPSAETSVNNLAIVINRPVNGDTIPLSEGIDMRITISGSSSKTGTCTVTATGPSGQTATRTADFTPQSSYSSCAVMIPSSQLTTGVWTTSLTVTSGGATSKAITQKVTLQ